MLTMLEPTAGRTGDGHRLALYRCDCGEEKLIASSRVNGGYARSCGCQVAEAARAANTTHGMRGSPEYGSWTAMWQRCRNPANKDYPRWGGVGVKVSDNWRDFATFLADVGPRPRGTTLDRINGGGNYEPGNVRWATPKEQARNRRDLTVLNTPLGRMALVDYAQAIGITKGAAHLRMKRGKLEGCAYV